MVKITLGEKEIKKILRNYAFEVFSAVLEIKTADEIELDIDCSYDDFRQLEITKKEEPEPKEEATA